MFTSNLELWVALIYTVVFFFFINRDQLLLIKPFNTMILYIPMLFSF